MMTKALSLAIMAAMLSAVGASTADAHVFGAAGAGVIEGFVHPFIGLDHLLAMIAAGLWASQIGGRAAPLVLVIFPGTMIIGAALAIFGAPFPGVELAVASSVAALGALIAGGVRPPLLPSCGLIALFALAHGYAHGAELPETASPIAYGGGFIVATLTLHLVGIWLGSRMRDRRSR